MFNIDPKTRQRIAPGIGRVLVIDPHMASARLVGELMKEIGAREVVTAAHGGTLMFKVQDLEPQIILTELRAPGYDALAFIAQLRRSPLAGRQAPVIVMTAEATAASILGARNAGAHEFLRKPFTAGDLYRRIENVVLKPRPWIEAQMYVGPDRRRFNSGAEFAGPKKRRNDGFPAAFAQKAG